jgi:hypothetical protein
MAFLTVSFFLLATTASALAVSIPDGSLSITADGGWPHEYGGGAYHSPVVDLAALGGGSPVALRGWVDLSQTQLPSAGAPYYFQFVMIDMDFQTNGWGARQEIKTNFTTATLGGWHGIPPQPWDRVRMETTNLAAPAGEQWYCTEGGTHDMAGGGTIYPSDRVYYFQLIVDPSTRAADLWVYGKGNPGDGPAPNWNSAVDQKQWYQVSSYTIPAAFNLSDMLVYPDLFASPDAEIGSVSTVSWQGMEIGPSVSLQQAPPAPSAIPEPMTMLAFGSAVAGLGGYIRRRRRA